jgi:hypothetical protein
MDKPVGWARPTIEDHSCSIGGQCPPYLAAIMGLNGGGIINPL